MHTIARRPAAPGSVPSRRNGCSPEEWAVRVDLAAAYRLVALYGMDDLVQTHISARIPGKPGHFLINPFGWLFSEITASSLIEIDGSGQNTDRAFGDLNYAGFVIHGAVHEARPDVDCVMHTHSQAGIAVSVLSEGLLPLSQWSMLFHNRLGCHAYEGVALELGERERIEADLGPHHALLLRNHGLLTAGRSVAHAFYLMYYLDRACRVQMQVLATGRPLEIPDPDTCERAARQFEDDPVPMGQREWPALLRELDRVDPGFRL
ncbi:class II aldolase/adducin family protein [Roseomonas sp. OT10]|uniref:class II aldolase/adducin family protein n=1 Tax=Roseomonas cutis TaxID=2897332 RepID=UPI001E38D004|nr:class II aldolase/adducin family protein [Roseomonas sp. OT10]UFN48522.1 class II aldolase/adducin family protein [Roseomonas sp. OT10]